MELGLMVLRAIAGLLFIGHGAQKVFGWFGGHGREGTGQFFESVGLRPGRRLAVLAGAAEMTGGSLILLGLVTPLGAALLSAVMLTAIWTVHRSNGLWMDNGGYEYNLVLLGALFALSAVGAGKWSLDHAFGLEVAGAGWALGALAAGVLGAAVAVALGRREVRYRSGGVQPARG